MLGRKSVELELILSSAWKWWHYESFISIIKLLARWNLIFDVKFDIFLEANSFETLEDPRKDELITNFSYKLSSLIQKIRH